MVIMTKVIMNFMNFELNEIRLIVNSQFLFSFHLCMR